MSRKQKLLHLIIICVYLLSCFIYGTMAAEGNTGRDFNLTMNSLNLSDECKAALTTTVTKYAVGQQCTQLHILKLDLINAGCDKDRLDKFEAKICPTAPISSTIQSMITKESFFLDAHNSTPDTRQTTVIRPSTAQPHTLTTMATTMDPIIAEQKKKALEYINQNVKSEDCKMLVSAAAGGLSSLEAACTLTETVKETLKEHCSEADMEAIKTAVCIVKATTTLSPEEIIRVQKQKALDYINVNVNSEDCKNFSSLVAETVSSLEMACGLIETQKEALKDHCSEADIEVIKRAVCVDEVTAEPSTTSAPDKDADAHREKVLCVIDTQLSSKTCKATARGQAEGKSDRVEGCNTLKMFEPLLAQFDCTVDDYKKLHEVICEDKDVPCTPVGPVDEVVKTLTSRCKSTINVQLNNLKSPTGCSILQSSKDQLLNNLICTPGDIEKLHQIVCSQNNATADASIASGGRMDEAVETIQTKLSNRCRDVIGYQLRQKITLQDLCLKVKSAGPTLVTRGYCTQDDYDALEPAVCVVPRVYEPKEQQQRDEIHQIIIALSSECKRTMLDQEKQMQESTVDMACQKLTASHDVLLSTQTCDETEIKKLNAVICNGASGRVSFAWTLSLLVLLVNMWN